MIGISEVEQIHEILIERFGGAKGISDRGILESAIGRPFQTFDGKDLYPGPVDKAAAIFESIISNHPFVDGNKRTAYVLMRLILKTNQLDIDVDQDAKYDFVLQAASGQLTFVKIRAWIEHNLK
ncbi:MAG TPA: type II toxin-antitoxin system death-on-curing family toxin [Cyclobacteriaceae bacterium]|nr:type II toxin-antitoxin system death-on-curing family toxin [Cyclobacteriaceae bacterium]HMV10066.1 type II toxin-antitoxin system death-on-curing family toxin [Cyclobacteriaceae bacterium]HMV90918.1 type II toxin-antitoxin system death-on-curing family toxin [Cyclobacteriaceae bacterium]HMW99837.1 type II toxin-antitoxin system death-on-curing family toxin [Cyclobacteriaceae bacterium]HMX49300.1 type II toxin-antitoxin system death-on-curing family toxin [Cyclobacteriaceae bacterium]